MRSKLAALTAKKQKLDAQIQALKNKEKSAQRKVETRRKILLGGMVLHLLKMGEMSEERLKTWLDHYLKEDRDRMLFGLALKAEGVADAGRSTIAVAEGGTDAR